jgi:hypothetical protein
MKTSLAPIGVGILAFALVCGDRVACAQQAQNVAAYLQQGYQIINSTVGSGYLMLVLKKDTQLTICSVTIETGQTAGCQSVK